MTDSIKLRLFGKEGFLRRTSGAAPAVLPALLAAMKKEMLRVSDYVRATKLSGQVLNRRSGDLSRSITGQAVLKDNSIEGRVGSYGVPYAPVHEYGGTFDIPATSRMITHVFGRPVFPHPVLVSAHTATFPVRSYIRTSAAENATRVNEALKAAVAKVLNAT